MQYFLGLRHPLQHRMKQYQIDRAFQMLRNILSRALYKMHVVDHTFIGGRLASHHLSGEIAERHVMAQLRDFDGRLPFAAAGIQHPQRSRPQLRQQRFQILPEDRLTQLAFCGAVNIARKLFSNVIEIAILHE